MALVVNADAAQFDPMCREPWRFYRTASIAKRDGSGRSLLIPHEQLMSVQRRLVRHDLARFVNHPADHCRLGRSVITNAWRHVRHRYVSAYDIADCYPSIQPEMVRAALRRAGMTAADSDLVVKLTTVCRQLPQGAPTSPALLSIALHRVDCQLSARAARHGIVYTRYVDDLFFSGNASIAFFDREVRTVLSDAGFAIRRDKRRRGVPGIARR